ncbi:carboxylesterase/lipase family protein [Clostridiales bacterium]|nr:carboxylesterase/lipase family protein [Clostridiales bacterium]
MKKKLWILAILACFALALCGCGGSDTKDTQEAASDTSAICQNGNFVGQVEEKTKVISFKGVPYAKAPVGDLRWKAPEAPEASDETIEAKDFGKTSIQYEWPSEPASYNEIGEDCLTLNVWTKDLNAKDKPVMVYFHGGGFAWGGSSDPLYDGQYFVEQNEDIVMVTANYRVGFMGFIDFSKVEGGEAFADAPNLGILDHIQALKWVKENIVAFGGDPDNVTIFGESAGGGTTSALLVVDQAKGLFNKCISQSGSVALTYSQEEVDEWGLTEALLKVTGAKKMDDLMAIPEKDLIKYYTEPFDEEGNCLNDLYNMPLRDGKLIPEDPYKALADGASKDVILMTGSNANEWNYWIEEMGEEDMDTAVKVYEEAIVDDKLSWAKDAAIKQEKKAINQFLDLQKDKEDLWAKTEFCNDIAFRVPAIVEAANHSNAGGKSYMYYFAKESDEENMKACHASEVAYVFHNLTGAGFSGTMDEKLANQMCAMWANFARTGNPSIDDVTWTPYDSKTRETMVIGNDSSLKMESDPLAQQRKLIEPLLKYYVK